MTAISRTMGAAAAVCLFVSCAAASRDAGAERSRDMARGCAGLSDSEVADAVAMIRPTIESVEPKYETVSPPKGTPTSKLDGAIIYVHATPGITPEWLTRILSCHAFKHDAASCAAKDRCPLGLAGIQLSTTSTSMGFAIAIESRDREVAEEIVRRSRAFFSSP